MFFRLWFIGAKLAPFLVIFILLRMFFPESQLLTALSIFAITILFALCFAGVIMSVLHAFKKLFFKCPFCSAKSKCGMNNQEGIWLECPSCGWIHQKSKWSLTLVREPIEEDEQEMESEPAPPTAEVILNHSKKASKFLKSSVYGFYLTCLTILSLACFIWCFSAHFLAIIKINIMPKQCLMPLLIGMIILVFAAGQLFTVVARRLHSDMETIKQIVLPKWMEKMVGIMFVYVFASFILIAISSPQLKNQISKQDASREELLGVRIFTGHFFFFYYCGVLMTIAQWRLRQGFQGYCHQGHLVVGHSNKCRICGGHVITNN